MHFMKKRESSADDMSASKATKLQSLTSTESMPVKATTCVASVENVKEVRNWLIHELYTRREFTNCQSIIETQLRETEGMCEYALYVKGLLKRNEGKLSESLALFNTAVLVNPNNVVVHKQIGRSLYLLKRYELAISKFGKAIKLRERKSLEKDWQLEYYTGLCHMKLRQNAEAVKAFMRSMQIERQEETFVQLCVTLIAMNDYRTAIEVCEEGINFALNNRELLALAGKLYLHTHDTGKAEEYFVCCLRHEPCNRTALMGLCSIIQNTGNSESALDMYQIALSASPSSAQLWTNIGVCFAAMNNTIAAVACLRKACFIAPLEWLPQYNLGIVYLVMNRYVSAFQHLSCAINLNDKLASAYMYLGTCLSFLNDVDNACASYEKALQLCSEPIYLLNYAVMLWNSALLDRATQLFARFSEEWNNTTPELREYWQQTYPTITATVKELQNVMCDVEELERGEELQNFVSKKK